MSKTLKQHADAIEAAPGRYREAISRLTRRDGSRVFSDAEHKEREAAAWTEWRSVIQGAADAAAEAIRAAASEIEGIAGGLLDARGLERLTTSEIQRAAALDHFVSEDFSTLPLETLARRTEEAATSDRVSQLVHYRAARSRLARHEAERAEPLTLVNGRPVLPGSAMTADEQRLLAAVDTLATSLVDPGDAAKRDAAEARASAAHDLGMAAMMAEVELGRVPRPTVAVRASGPPARP